MMHYAGVRRALINTQLCVSYTVELKGMQLCHKGSMGPTKTARLCFFSKSRPAVPGLLKQSPMKKFVTLV